MSDDRVKKHIERALEGNLEKERDKLDRQGKRFVRDRLARLLDPGSFAEDGLLAFDLAALSSEQLLDVTREFEAQARRTVAVQTGAVMIQGGRQHGDTARSERPAASARPSTADDPRGRQQDNG